MTPPIKPAKLQLTQTLDGRLHIAAGLGPKGKPIFKPQVFIVWGVSDPKIEREKIQ
jgi:hypothetical protein